MRPEIHGTRPEMLYEIALKTVGILKILKIPEIRPKIIDNSQDSDLKSPES